MSETPEYEAAMTSLLKTNKIPSELEKRAISASLTAFKAQLRNLESTAHDADNGLGGATRDGSGPTAQQSQQQQRDELQTAIRRCKQVLNPVRRLPGNVLANIFHETVEFPAAVELNDAPDGQKWWEPDVPPFMMWALELVCKAWREAALSDPSLWASINIVVPVNASGSSTAPGLSRLATQLSRTQLCPLFISVVTTAHYAAEIDALPCTLVAVLLPFAHRIQDLYLHLPLELVWCLAPLRYRLHSLAYLSIVNTPYQDHPIHYPIDVFSECPRLRRLNIGDDTEPAVHFMVPWHILHYVTLEHALLDSEVQPTSSGPMPRSIRHVLRQAQELLFCQVTLEASDSTLDVSPITCESLWSLTITCYPSNDEPGQQHPLIQLLHNLHLPSLFELSIDSIYHPRMSPAVFTAVADLIERSTCPLSALAYGGGDVPEDDLLRVLHLSKELDSLRLTMVGTSLTDRFIHTLADESEGGLVAPCLETLALSGLMHFTASTFLDMVKKRWEERPFAEVELDWIVRAEEHAQMERTATAITDGLNSYEGLIVLISVTDQTV